MRNRATGGDCRMHRTIVRHEVPCLVDTCTVTGMTIDLDVQMDFVKNLRMLIALLCGNCTVVALDCLSLALHDTLKCQESTLTECHQHAEHWSRGGVREPQKRDGIFSWDGTEGR